MQSMAGDKMTGPAQEEMMMKKMMSLVLFTMLCGAAGLSSATVHYECKDTGKGKCVAPTPPTPPAPPALPPLPHLAGLDGARIAPPAPPAVPAPPPPPAIPDVPEEAHRACAGKADGSRATYVIKKGETMTGICESENGKMVFQLRTYHLD